MSQNRTKYPRTFHLPWSLGATDDDKTLKNTDHFVGKRVIITEKMDGENTSCYSDGTVHARSIDSKNHPSRNWVKNFWGTVCWLIDDNARICGENMFAQHSIIYDNLESYFYGFSYWEDDFCLDWETTMDYFDLVGITPVNVLYDGIWDEYEVKDIIANLDLNSQEGIVVRLADGFHYDDFSNSVAKWVRKDHVQTDEHWTKGEVKPNGLKEC